MSLRVVLIPALLLIGLGAAAAAAADLAPVPIPGGLGVNVHFVRPAPGELDAMVAAGVRVVREDFYWTVTERAKGIYDFSRYEALQRDLAAHGIRAWFILDYGNPLYDTGSPHTDASRAAFAAWAAAAARRFAGRDVIWEMWNEPNGTFWKPKPNPDDYAKLSLATGRAIHAADPAATYVGPGTSGVDVRFIDACLQAGCLDDWAAVSVHPYRRAVPDRVGKDYDALRKLIARHAHGRSVPILSGEWGYSAAWKNHDEQTQADDLARSWLVNQWQRVLISIWYDWRDDGVDPANAEHHFGLVRHGPATRPGDADLKPAYVAARTLSTVLAGYSCTGRARTDSADDYAILFANGDRRIVAAWTAAKSPHALSLPVSPGPFTVTSAMGDAGPQLTATDAGLTVPVGPRPVYLTPAGPNPKLTAMTAEQP